MALPLTTRTPSNRSVRRVRPATCSERVRCTNPDAQHISCANGQVDTSSYRVDGCACICDDGWQGNLCDTPTT